MFDLPEQFKMLFSLVPPSSDEFALLFATLQLDSSNAGSDHTESPHARAMRWLITYSIGTQHRGKNTGDAS